MVQQVTHNIKVAVETNFEGRFTNNGHRYYAFGYHITIDNMSQQTVQLKSRYWLIKDALKGHEVVEGPGVIGQQPKLEPGEQHSYSSGCLLVAPFGSMEGYYIFDTLGGPIKVTIPRFKLNAPFAMN